MVKIIRRLIFRRLAVLLVACLPLAAGCGETVVEEDVFVSMIAENADAIFPRMLDRQRLRVGNRILRLKARDISDIEIHQRSDKTNDGMQTAEISFTLAANPKPLRVKVQLTYKIIITQTERGREMRQYPLSKLKTLSAKSLGASNP